MFTKWRHAQTPDWESLVKLADFFGVTLDQLVGRLPAPHVPNGHAHAQDVEPREWKVLYAYRRNRKTRKLIDILIKG